MFLKKHSITVEPNKKINVHLLEVCLEGVNPDNHSSDIIVGAFVLDDVVDKRINDILQSSLFIGEDKDLTTRMGTRGASI